MWCGIYVTDHWTEWTQSYSGFFNHEFGSRIFGGIWLADSWAEAEYKGDTGMLSDFSAIILAQLPVQRKAKFAGESYGENRNE